ncbi:MAG: anion permease [Clostridiales bacterium]|nr:anion permease [Clostridiales bacterium]
MTINMIITLAVVILMIAVIMSDKLPFGAPALIACALLVVLNQATVADAFSGFVDKNVILICGFMVCMAGLQKTAFIYKLQNVLGNMAGKGGMKNYVLLLVAIMFAANFISGTAFYVLVLSVVATIPYKKELPNSRILMPAGMATYHGGWLPVNVALYVAIIGSLLESSGAEMTSISLTNYAIYKAVIAAVFLIWSLIGYRLLPDYDINEGKEVKEVKQDEWKAILTPVQEKIVYVGFILMIIGMLTLSMLPGEVGYCIPALIGGLYLCTGVINFKELLGQWFSPVCIMMASVIGVAATMSASGLTTLIGENVANALGATPAPIVIVLVFAVLTCVSSVFTGAAIGSAYIFGPIGISVAVQLGYDPTAVAFACGTVTWLNYVMPIDGLPALIMGMGKYKLTDFWKFQIPLWVISIVLTCIMSLVLYPM